MNMKFITPKLLLISAAVIVVAFMRLVPHWPNFTPVAAMALFAGATIGKKVAAFAIPFAAMLLSDLILGFHSTMVWVYLSFALTVGIGFLLSRNVKAGNLILATVSSSALFYLITNFGAWASGMMPYTHDFTGLTQAYIAGLPFFNNGLMGDLFYNAILFGGFYLVKSRYPRFA